MKKQKIQKPKIKVSIQGPAVLREDKLFHELSKKYNIKFHVTDLRVETEEIIQPDNPILQAVLSLHNLDYDDFMDNLNARYFKYALPRFEIMYFLRNPPSSKFIPYTCLAAEKALNKCHPAALHAEIVINNMIDTDKVYSSKFQILTELVKNWIHNSII